MLQSYSEVAARIRVPAGFVLAVVYLVFAEPTPVGLFWGAGVALAGLALRGTSAGYLMKNQKLATGGPYAYTRNPLYLGSAVAGLGLCIAAGRWWLFVLLGAFLAAVYWPVIRREEEHLRRLFPEEFPGYASAVPILAPRLRPWRSGSTAARFDWRRYRDNREYQALLAYLAIVLLLAGKVVYGR